MVPLSGLSRLTRPLLLVAAVWVEVAYLAAYPDPLSGQDRFMRTFAQENGLKAPPVWALVQDSLGFIWIGAEGGLYRFDGSEIRPWAPQEIGIPVRDLAVSVEGRVAAVDGEGRLYEVTGSGVRAVPMPWPPSEQEVRADGSLAWSNEGTLWMLYGDMVVYRSSNGWDSLAPEAFGGEIPRLVAPTRFGGALVATWEGLWRVRSDSAPERLFEGAVITDAVEPEAGRILILVNVTSLRSPRVVEVSETGERELLPDPGPLWESRAIGLVERRGTVWVAVDRFLAALRPGGELEVMGTAQGLESGGPLLVDREGSLWLGSYIGLHQYPEPDTWLLSEREGLSSRHTRFLARSENTLWVMTWGRPNTIRREEEGWRVDGPTWESRSRICTEQDGTAWTATDDGLILEIHGTAVTPRADLPAGQVDGCTQGRDGGMWLGTPTQVIYVHGRREGQRVFPQPMPGSQDPHMALLQDSHDRLWLRAGLWLCHAQGAALLAQRDSAWSCAHGPGSAKLTSMVELPDGRLWASADQSGLYAFDGQRWTPVLIDGFPTRTVFKVVPSRRGGIWIVGAGVLRARPSGESGVEVLEELSAWQGVPPGGASDLVESEDGDIWLATNRGVARVPVAARFDTPPVPPVALVDGRVDGQPFPLDRSLILPHERNRLELRFAALSFRDRTGLRQEVRLGPDRPWSESGSAPFYRWVDLPAGSYQVEYRASHDGVVWSSTAARFSFIVQPPWYGTWWFIGLMSLTVTGVAMLIYRARVGYLLGLERQRTRIAMDLHDQVGSGLASVGILSGVIAEGDLRGEERRRTAREIADVAEELGHSLSDIVWSLDPRTATLEELATRLAEHGERLFADGALFQARFPDEWPSVRSEVAVRRNVLLIGLEALHNAARHSGARHVDLSFLPSGRQAWELTVRDDGAGLTTEAYDSAVPNRGHGLDGMARRAEEIAATLTVTGDRAHGTTVTVRFHPEGGPDVGLVRRLLASARGLTRMIMRAPHAR